MTPIDIANQIIPGFNTLSPEQLTLFLSSTVGQQFNTFVDQMVAKSTTLSASVSWWELFFGHIEEKQQAFKDDFNEGKEQLLSKIGHSAAYQVVITHITLNILKNDYPNIELLDPAQQLVLASADFSQTLLAPIVNLDQTISRLTEELQQLEPWQKMATGGIVKNDELAALIEKKNAIMADWYEQFLIAPDLATIKQALAQKKLITLYQQQQPLVNELTHCSLADAIPLLHHQKPPTTLRSIHTLLAVQQPMEINITADNNHAKQVYLANLLVECMHELGAVHLNFMDLEQFNQQCANEMAVMILNAFNQGHLINLDNLLATYELKLTDYIQKQLLLINNSPWRTPLSYGHELWNSLSYLLMHNKTINKLKEFTDHLAEAHSFIQATSFATQNESSYLAILDLYNYGRYTSTIAETKSIIISLVHFLLPLYEEYKDNALFEKNSYWKLFRTLMPIIITVAFVVVVTSLLSFLALPELVLTLVLIPTLIVGLALAAKYVGIKNDIYKSCRSWYYGGDFEIPEFQVNQRLLTAFKQPETAHLIRDYYVKEICACDEQEQRYQQKYALGILNDNDIKLRKDNRAKRHLLCLEWYDIHSNNSLSYEDIPHIAKARLQQDSASTYQALEQALANDHAMIKQSVAQLVFDLKTTLTKPDALHLTRGTDQSSIKQAYTPAFFAPPRSLELKARTETLVDYTRQISTCCP